MNSLDILVAYCCCLLSVVQLSVGKSGFIVTAPKLIDAGSTEYLTLTVFDVPQGGEVTLRLLHEYTNELLSESKVTVPNNYNMWVEMSVPPMSSDTKAKLQVLGSFSDGYKIDMTKEVRIRHNTVLIFVQTDKPLYKPGQTVRFRVLPMDSQLKPLAEDTVGDIWIEDPSGIRVAQWKQEKFIQGMREFELPLSEEPPLGTWSIRSVFNKVTSVQKFEVEKYVLPKFEVIINPPDYVLADAETITSEICARYTYGKNVDGTLNAKITYKKLSWQGSRPIPSVEHIGQISGCHIFVVNAHDLLLHSNEFGYRTIEIFAEVIENVTGIVRNASASVQITHSPLQLEFMASKSNTDYFKPGIPFYGKLQVKRPDDSVAASEKVEICASFRNLIEVRGRSCHTFTSDKQGMIRFSVAPQQINIVRIQLEAEAVNYQAQKYSGTDWREKIERPHASMHLFPWHSPSNNYLQIEPIVDELQCEKLQRVKIRYTAERGSTIKFYHQVLSRGRIVQQGSHQRTFYSTSEEEMQYDLGEGPSGGTASRNKTADPDIGEFILSFDPRATMSPVARLLIFYVREDGEIVADSRMFRIDKCLLNKVSLHFRHEQQYPSTEAAMLLSASPSSVCGIGLVDKSVRFLRKDTQFDKNTLFKLMETYDVGKNDQPRQETEEYCFGKDQTGVAEDRNIQWDPPYGRHRIFSRSYSLHVDASIAFDVAGMVVITDMELETRPCLRSFPIAHYMKLDGDFFPHPETPVLLRSSSRGVPGQVSFPKPEPKKEPPPKSTEEIRSYFPETWLWEMHTVGPSGETAIKRQLPHTITEWTGGAVCVHPETGLGISDTSSITAFQPFFISFQLPYSVIRGERLPLVVSVFNYLSECLPIKLSLEPSEDYKTLSENRFHKMCVCGEESVSTRFLLRPVNLGRINITIYGFSMEDDDEVCGNEITARLSARDAITKQLLVEAEGFPKEEVFNYYICPENSNGSYASEVDLLLPEDVITGSSRAYLSVSGDLMGPALNGLHSLVRLPVGCGEQNMVLFVPNIFVMDYLTATGKITEEVRKDCLKNMKTGYQRELQYRHGDGSYSAFGQSDGEGSLWLTAFVLKSFGQARRFVDVDEHDLRRSTAWILEKQFENGCFEPSGPLIHKEMKGGLNEGEQSFAPLTAYVLISLLESGAERPDHGAIRNGLKCLESERNPSNYAAALFAYANALAKEPLTAKKYLQLLEERADKKGNEMYWDSNKSTKSTSIAVEIAGYYILAHMELDSSDGVGEVLPVVRWITRQRNSNGGFVSTQDTIVALQALAKFSAQQSRTPVDIGLVAESDDLVRGFKLDESNKLVSQSVKIPTLPTVVELQAVGDGCAVVQFSLRYNVEKVSGSDAFDLNVNVVRLGSSDCNLPRIEICMRYKMQDQTSNMVVVSVKMASGYIPDEWSLFKLRSDAKVKLKRHEIDGNEVNLYFNELTHEQKCFMFFVKSEIEVEEVKPAIIKLYDYYQPELEVTKEYTIPSSCTASSLPELPFLPPVLIDAEVDEDLDDILSMSTETSTKLRTTDSTEIDTSPTSKEVQPTTASDVETTTVYWTEDVVELSDDARQTESPASHLVNFVDISQDLDFPDGIEGNAAVSVLPPEEVQATTTELPDLPYCPICSDEFPENFTEIYCNAAFALRSIVREGKSAVIKILQDVSYHMSQPKVIKKFAKLPLDDKCICPQLREKGKILLIMGTPITLWDSKKEKHQIQLTNQVFIVSPPTKEVLPAQLRHARNLCEEDP